MTFTCLDCHPLEDSQPSSSSASTGRDFGLVKFPSTKAPTPTTLEPNESLHSKHAKKHEHPDWLVYTSAIPTVFVFVMCVVIIFVKQHYAIK